MLYESELGMIKYNGTISDFNPAIYTAGIAEPINSMVKTGPFYFYRNDSLGTVLESFSIGSNTIVSNIPIVKPDYERVLLGETRMIDFDVIIITINSYIIEVDDRRYAYDEILVFSEDCSDVQPTDPRIYRQPDGSFEQLDTSLFTTSGFRQI